MGFGRETRAVPPITRYLPEDGPISGTISFLSATNGSRISAYAVKFDSWSTSLAMAPDHLSVPILSNILSSQTTYACDIST